MFETGFEPGTSCTKLQRLNHQAMQKKRFTQSFKREQAKVDLTREQFIHSHTPETPNNMIKWFLRKFHVGILISLTFKLQCKIIIAPQFEFLLLSCHWLGACPQVVCLMQDWLPEVQTMAANICLQCKTGDKRSPNPNIEFAKFCQILII